MNRNFMKKNHYYQIIWIFLTITIIPETFSIVIHTNKPYELILDNNNHDNNNNNYYDSENDDDGINYGRINSEDHKNDPSDYQLYSRYLNSMNHQNIHHRSIRNPCTRKISINPKKIIYKRLSLDDFEKKRAATAVSSSSWHSPSFSFNGDMRFISNLRHMMTGSNPLTAIG
ncbi:unnamed protein product [Heterobilharzia americana]|nr:unnamed protein product [Heterobilharzia americana]